jgi:ferrochelatase
VSQPVQPHVPAKADPSPYDALLLVSFGGPEAPDEVMPFLERVTAGRGVPHERLLEVAEHYHHFGGRSPINHQNRALIAALEADLAAAGVDVPVYWGNRNSEPFLDVTLERMAADGVRTAAAVLTSAYSSYSGCRQYREDLAAASAAVVERGVVPPELDRVRHYFDHPGFVAANADALLEAYGRLDPGQGRRARVVFVTHSIPTAMAETSGAPDAGGWAYVRQHEDAAAAVVDAASSTLGFVPEWDLVYCSRSGSPQVPWLEPDVNDHLEALHEAGADIVVLAPIGFVSDHMEVVFDLDTEAAETAERIGTTVVRAATAGTHPAFVAAIRELLLERAASRRGEPDVARPVAGALPPSHDVCPVGCCRNLRGPKPALCGVDAPVLQR